MSPSVYVRTVTEDTGASVAPETVSGIKRVFENSVPELSGGRFSLAAFEWGRDGRAPETGWIIVAFYHVLPAPYSGYTGVASVGGDTGYIKLVDQGVDPRSPCETAAVGAAEHEIVHSMGFYHTDLTNLDFHSSDCSGVGRPERARFHAKVMYSRPQGNADQDVDPGNFTHMLFGAEPATQQVVACRIPYQ